MDEIKTKHYHLWRENDVLVAVVKGQYDFIATQAYCRNFKTIAAPLINAPWGHITYLDEWDLATPDCIQLIAQLENWCKSNRLACDALVYRASGIKDFVLSAAMATSKNPDVYQHFEYSADALNWLREKGFNPTSHTLSPLKCA
ncbi:hypothetical protein [Alteromonas flava]|uniref:hypothetical protein n=1 Tax=Alteromonas flava TaxID=2048003 RepID=UPI000C292669|nr:hypothetical protein [Alteromonas flava]